MMHPLLKETFVLQLEKFKTVEDSKGVIILYKGKQLILPSGKRIWATKQHAASALSNALSTRDVYSVLPREQLQRYASQLEKEGIIELKTLT